MPRTIRTKVYKFEELSKQAKDKAIEWYQNTDNLDYQFIWDNIKDDAKEIGLKLISLSDHNKNEGEFLLAANEVAQNIFNNHGEICETYKTAEKFMKEWQPVFNEYMNSDSDEYETLDSENKIQELEEEFLRSLLEDYRIMYNADIDYQNSKGYAIETIIANEYEFTIDGKQF